MKTLNEIYNEVIADKNLIVRYKNLHSAEEQVAFVRELGGNASAEEIAEFWNERNSKTVELSDAELEQVVGGKGGSGGSGKNIHRNCGGEITYRTEKVAGQWQGYYFCWGCGEMHHTIDEFDYYVD